jgi:hypothetical protein
MLDGMAGKAEVNMLPLGLPYPSSLILHRSI